MPLIIEHIDFGFSSERKLINNLSFRLEEGNVYALLGTNGAGKTTLFNIISGFLKLRSGDISFNGKHILNLMPFQIALMGVSRTFQDMRLATKLTVKENVMLSMKNNPTDSWLNSVLPSRLFLRSQQKLEVEANSILRQYFLDGVESSRASDISYGQQKLLSLACCVAQKSDLLLLDEPVAGIQPEYRNKIADLIRQLKSEGKIIFVIEHNIDFIDNIANKIFFLHDGSLTTFPNIESLKKDQVVMNAYI